MRKSSNTDNSDTSQRHVLIFGVDQLNYKHYLEESSSLTYAKSANYYYEFFNNLGFNQVNSYVDNFATYERLLSSLRQLSLDLDYGDLLVLSFTGHGVKFKKESYSEEYPKFNEYGWKLYNKVFLSIELWELLRSFRPGVKVVILSDACYSSILESETKKAQRLDEEKSFLERNWKTYESVLMIKGRPRQFQVPASVAIISSAPEFQKSEESSGLSVFAESFKLAWDRILYDTSLNLLDLHAEMLKIIIQNHSNDTPIKQRIRWHYCQGHEYTRLAGARPFGIK